MKKFFLCLLVLAVFAPVALLAQDGEPVTFDLAVVMSIMTTGIAGISVAGLIEMIKRFLKWTDFKVYIIALGVSAGAVVAYLLALKMFDWTLFAGYTILVFGQASGLYKMVKKPKPE